MRLLMAVVAALLALATPLAPPALAQAGPDAGLNQYYFHGPKEDENGINGLRPGPDSSEQTQTAPTNFGDPEDPAADDNVISWRSKPGLDTGIAAGKEIVFRWYFSTPNAEAVLIGASADIRVLAVNASDKARVIGAADDQRLVVSAPTNPVINENVVKATGRLNTGERLFVQVVPHFSDTGPGLTAHYDSPDTASGFSVRTPTPDSGTNNPGVDGLPSADTQGLAFSASLPADPQRDESEPNIEIDGDGNIYTCGPTGVSNAAEYAQVSLDGGNQFHLLGEPPRGQQAPGGGGDCGFATSPVRNPDTKLFNYAYSGLGPLTNFATAASGDLGKTLRASQTTGIPGVDRQWHTFLDEDSVLISYNQQQPRQVVVQRSDDGGVNYSPLPVAATSTNPDFPGPMRSLPAALNPEGKAKGRVPFFGWSRDNQIYLAISYDEGGSWHNCKLAKAPGSPSLFTTVDADSAGNIYAAYSENATFHTYVVTLPIGKLKTCTAAGSEVDPSSGVSTESTPVQAAVDPPVQVDRDAVRTSLFSWITASGAPGRVAVSFYGSETDGDPNIGPGTDDNGKPVGFRGSWDVYVSQSLNADKPDATFAQVKATTHPFHYDSICLNGLGCDIGGGDRSLADFFASDFSPKRHALSVVYNQGYKRPDDAAGQLATPAVITQIAGPTLDGAPVEPAQGAPLDNGREDPAGDALADYSHLCIEADCPPKPTADKPEPGVDIRSVSVGPQADPETGKPVANGGFNVTMRIADLSDAALQQALADQRSTSLLYVFRWINGFRSAAAVATYDPARGFRFGFNGFSTGSVSCGGSGSKCLTYPGDEEVPGKVDAAKGTITISVPLAKLKALTGSTGPGQRPKEGAAGAGSRFYDATAFTLAAVVPPDSPEQSFLYPFDNAPAFDFLTAGALGGPTHGDPDGNDKGNGNGPGPGPGGGGPGPGGTGNGTGERPPGCIPSSGLARVKATGRSGGRLRLFFSRRTAAPVRVDVFRVSKGRKVIRERLVARFRDQTEPLTWNGRGRHRVGDGYYFVRYTMTQGGRKIDVRRVVLQRRHGRFSRRPSHYRRDSCGPLRKFKLERPVFGGPKRVTLKASYRLGTPARVTVTITRRGKAVKRFPAASQEAGRTYRLTLPAAHRPRGDYQVRLHIETATETLNTALTARRL